MIYREKRFVKNKQSISDLLGNLKWTNICVMWVTKRDKRVEKAGKKFFLNNSPNFSQFDENDKPINSSTRKIKKTTPSHINLFKTNDKKNLKAVSENMCLTHVIYSTRKLRLGADSRLEAMQVRTVEQHLRKYGKNSTVNPDFYSKQKYLSNMKAK